jgi:hypothetical protein
MKSKRTIKNKKKYNKNKIIHNKNKRKLIHKNKKSKKGGALKTYDPKCEHALAILTIDDESLHQKILEKMDNKADLADVFTEYTEQISTDHKQRNKKNANYYNERLLRSFFDCFKKNNKNFEIINGYFKEI